MRWVSLWNIIITSQKMAETGKLAFSVSKG